MVSLSKGAMNVAGAKMYFENHYPFATTTPKTSRSLTAISWAEEHKL